MKAQRTTRTKMHYKPYREAPEKRHQKPMAKCHFCGAFVDNGECRPCATRLLSHILATNQIPTSEEFYGSV